MSWTGGATRATGDVITSAIWNNHMGAGGDIDVLSTHVHNGVAGQGSSSLGPMVKADYTDAAAPAAPGAGLTRLYGVSSRVGYRAGAAGAAKILVDQDTAEPLTSKTLIAPVIADFTNAQHDHNDADDGGVAAGVPLRAVTTANVTKNASTVLGNITGLAVPLEINSTYIFKALVKYSTGGTPKIKLAFTVPAGATLTWQVVEELASGTLAEAEIGTSGTALGFEGGGSNGLALIDGIVVNGANAGDLQGQFAQNTSDASDPSSLNTFATPKIGRVNLSMYNGPGPWQRRVT